MVVLRLPFGNLAMSCKTANVPHAKREGIGKEGERGAKEKIPGAQINLGTVLTKKKKKRTEANQTKEKKKGSDELARVLQLRG